MSSSQIPPRLRHHYFLAHPTFAVCTPDVIPETCLIYDLAFAHLAHDDILQQHLGLFTAPLVERYVAYDVAPTRPGDLVGGLARCLTSYNSDDERRKDEIDYLTFNSGANHVRLITTGALTNPAVASHFSQNYSLADRLYVPNPRTKKTLPLMHKPR